VLLAPGAGNAGVRPQADIFIVCIIEKEFNATLAAFGLNQRETKLEFITGHRIAQVQLDTRYCGRVNIWIGLVGEARNVVCTHFCRDVFERFAVRQCCILIGIAAGYEEATEIGDVVGGRQIWDIEGARVEPSGEKPRLRPYPLRAPWSETFLSFDPERWNWLGERERALEVLEASGEKVREDWRTIVPTYKPGIIVAGEKLRRDAPLSGLRERFGDEILAIEMEGAGFASACERMEKRWLVFRGVSDYGTMKKRDEWQSLAALHAALAARSFIIDGLPAAEDSSLNPQF
jgi:nucleoside phosphorylase